MEPVSQGSEADEPAVVAVSVPGYDRLPGQTNPSNDSAAAPNQVTHL